MNSQKIFFQCLILSLLLHSGAMSYWLSQSVTQQTRFPVAAMQVSFLDGVPTASSAPPSKIIQPQNVTKAVAAKPVADTRKPASKKTRPISPTKTITHDTHRQEAKPNPMPAPASEAVSTNALAAAGAPKGATGQTHSAPIIAASYNAAYLRNPSPKYPPISRRLGEEGRLVLRVKVSKSGRPQVIELRQSSGFKRLDEAARKTVQGWTFVPARRGNEPLESWVDIPIQFILNE